MAIQTLKILVAFATTLCGHWVNGMILIIKPYNLNPNLPHMYNDIAWLIKP
jgi:hypothetical protein